MSGGNNKNIRNNNNKRPSHTKQLGNDNDRLLQFFNVEGTKRKYLNNEQVEQYNNMGYVFPIDIFSTNEIKKHKSYFDLLVEKAMEKGHDAYSIMNWHNICTGLYDLAYNPKILDIVEDLLGPNLVLFRAHYFCKLPAGQDDRVVTFHQDAPYWPITPSKCVTVWLAITDVNEENGAMTFVDGTHKLGLIPYSKSKKEERNVLNLTVHDPEKYGSNNKKVCLKAGQASLHSDLLLHGSGINESNQPRIGLALSYHPPDVRAVVNGRRGFGFLCRGIDIDNYWNLKPKRPIVDRIPKFHGVGGNMPRQKKKKKNDKKKAKL